MTEGETPRESFDELWERILAEVISTTPHHPERHRRGNKEGKARQWLKKILPHRS